MNHVVGCTRCSETFDAATTFRAALLIAGDDALSPSKAELAMPADRLPARDNAEGPKVTEEFR